MAAFFLLVVVLLMLLGCVVLESVLEGLPVTLPLAVVDSVALMTIMLAVPVLELERTVAFFPPLVTVWMTKEVEETAWLERLEVGTTMTVPEREDDDGPLMDVSILIGRGYSKSEVLRGFAMCN